MSNPHVTNDDKGKPQNFYLKLSLFLVGLAMVGAALVINFWPTSPPGALPDFPSFEVTPQSSAAVNDFFNLSILPLIEEMEEKNKEAKERALASLHDQFDGFRRGTADFSEDITGWGRFGIAKNWTKDKWDLWINDVENADNLTSYVNDKFRQHVLNEEQLQSAINDPLVQFTGDMIANQNELLAKIKTTLSSSALPPMIQIPEKEFNEFTKRLSEQFIAESTKIAGKTVVQGILAIVGSTVAEEAVRRTVTPMISKVVAPIIARIATSTAATLSTQFAAVGATAGGATVVTTATGGGVGSFVPGIGTVVGFAVGVAVGAGIDWWMTERSKEEIITQLTSLLDSMEKNIIQGTDDADRKMPNGLSQAYDELIRDSKSVMTQAVLKTLHKGSAV